MVRIFGTSVRQEVLFVLGAFGIIILVALLLLSNWQDVISTDLKSIKIGIISSLIVSILFFGIVGISVFIAQIVSPKSHSFDSRIRYLYGVEHEGQTVFDYNREQLRKLAGYCFEAYHRSTLLNYDPELKAFRIKFERVLLIRNLLHDERYVYKIGINVAPDDFEGRLDVIGEMLSVTMKVADSIDVLLPTRHYIPQRGFYRDYTIELPKNAEGELKYEYWAWCKEGVEQECGCIRYAENLRFDLFNELEHAVVLKSILRDKEREIRIDGHSSEVICTGTGLEPGEGYQFWVSPVSLTEEPSDQTADQTADQEEEPSDQAADKVQGDAGATS